MIYTLTFSADHKSVTIFKDSVTLIQIFSKESLAWYILHLVYEGGITQENFLELDTDSPENELPESDIPEQPCFKPTEELIANKENIIRTIGQWMLS